MQLKVIRSAFTPTATLGKMYINDVFYAFTLEDTNRDLNGDCAKKVQNQTCIDFGTYEVILSFSDRFQKIMPQLLNVPCFAGIRIHGGNTAADTEGCILIGANSNMTDRIWNCADVVSGLITKLQAAQNTEKSFITIEKE